MPKWAHEFDRTNKTGYTFSKYGTYHSAVSLIDFVDYDSHKSGWSFCFACILLFGASNL
jgi:hypothetical protein